MMRKVRLRQASNSESSVASILLGGAVGKVSFSVDPVGPLLGGSDGCLVHGVLRDGDGLSALG